MRPNVLADRPSGSPRRGRVLPLLGLLALSLAAPPPLFASDLAKVRAAGRLVMITALNEAGEITRIRREMGTGYGGVERDLLEGFAKSLGVPLEFRASRDFASTFPDLEAGKGEVIGSSLTITAERRARMDFSVPYLPNRIVVIARKGTKVTSLRDLAGKRAITIAGTTLEAESRKIPGAQVRTTALQQDFYEAVEKGTADFFLGDGLKALLSLERHPELAIVYTYPERQEFGFALRRGSDLTPLLDAWLRRARATGELDDVIRRYYGDAALKIIRSWE